MPPKIYRKRRMTRGPSKNELRAARGDREEQDRSRSGTLRQRFPRAQRLALDLRLESPMGATLERKTRVIGPDEPLMMDVPCPGGCGGGRFLLSDAVEALLQTNRDSREGMAICQAASYNDSRVPCGTKLYYTIAIDYSGPPPEEAAPPAEPQA